VRPDNHAAVSDLSAAICLLFIVLVPFAGAGFSLINTGLNRSRSAAHGMLASLCVASVALLVYFTCGFAWQGVSGQPAHIVNAAGKPWNWIAAGPLFFRGFAFDSSPA